MSEDLQIPSNIDLAAFISREAHDLKSPFNRALGFIKLVLDGYAGPISQQAEDDLTVAYLNSQYTVKLMNALVEVARLEHGENEPSLEKHSLKIILTKTISEWKRHYHKKNTVKISFSAPDINIIADEIMIRQCIDNWISYVNEFVKESTAINLQVEEQSESCIITIRSSGTKQQVSTHCDLTLYGFIARGMLDLNQGALIQIKEHDQGAFVQFNLRKAD